MNIKYRLMVQADCLHVTRLLQANAQSQQGGLLGEYPLSKVSAMFTNSASTMIAHNENIFLGVVFSFDSQSASLPPIVHFIIEQYRAIIENNWFYGPVCIDKNYRGKNILKGLYNSICACHTGKPIAFINADNTRSLAAHLKIGMNNVAEFEFQNTSYILVKGN
ncbi:N-acetyltransferase [Providencia sp. Me31A]|uniref:N-acetyltransferase n=1 Tax=Providencia sp. Me31A TaxID=3392637 RepID=UPI003D2A338B